VNPEFHGRGKREFRIACRDDRLEAAGAIRWPLAIAAGCLATQGLSALPPLPAIGLLGVAACLLSIRRSTRAAGLALLAFTGCLVAYVQRAEDRLDGRHARAVVEVAGTVASVPQRYPDLVRFRFEPDDGATRLRLPAAIRVSWYEDAPPDLAVGQRWRLRMRLQPPWGRVNFRGADPEAWLFANGYGALGSVGDGERLEAGAGGAGWVQRSREAVERAIRSRLDEGAGQGVVLALAIADRSALGDTVRRLLVDTGTAHLLAISGLHVGLAATAGFGLVMLALAAVPPARRGRIVLHGAAAGGLATALAYALLADLGVSTLRAVAMVAVALAALLSARAVHPATPLAWAAAAVLLIDPFAPLGAGFWFSFIAVAALLWTFLPRSGRGRGWTAPVRAQLAVMLTLLPVSAAWFGQASAAALPANLLAIPWVSLLVVPPVLAGIALLPLCGEAAAALWGFAAGSAEELLWLLEALQRLGPRALALNALDPARLGLALGGAFVLLLPAALRWKWLAAFLLLPLLAPAAAQGPRGAMTLDVLDVGQGTAALLHAGSKTLLYDSGPGDGAGRNLVSSAIAPALGTGTPDRVVISHADLDHSGGLEDLSIRYPAADFRLNGPDGSGASCRTGWSWDWAGTTFRALHPSPGLPYLGNDSSCVLSVRGPGGRVLLAGDVSAPIEQRLLDEGLEAHEVLLVPHHGSQSSSSAPFIRRVAPRVAIATAALGNRFGFPREAVRERYRRAGIPLLTTGDCGGLRVVLQGGEVRDIASARRQRKRIWRWPAAGHCP